MRHWRMREACRLLLGALEQGSPAQARRQVIHAVRHLIAWLAETRRATRQDDSRAPARRGRGGGDTGRTQCPVV